MIKLLRFINRMSHNALDYDRLKAEHAGLLEDHEAIVRNLPRWEPPVWQIDSYVVNKPRPRPFDLAKRLAPKTKDREAEE